MSRAAVPPAQVIMLRSTSKSSLVTSSLVTMNDTLSAATADRLRAQQRWERSRGVSPMQLPEVLSNQAIQELMRSRAELASNYQKELETRLPDYPTVRQAKAQLDETNDQIARLAGSIRDSIRETYEVAARQEQAVQRDIQGLRANTLSEQDRGVRYGILRREVDTNREMYDAMLQRYKEVGAAAGVTANNITVVDTAEPAITPAWPKPLLNVLLALFLGVVSAAGLVFLREALDDSVRTPDDAESKLGLPLLGTVPRITAAPLTEAPTGLLWVRAFHLGLAVALIRLVLDDVATGIPGALTGALYPVRRLVPDTWEVPAWCPPLVLTLEMLGLAAFVLGVHARRAAVLLALLLFTESAVSLLNQQRVLLAWFFLYASLCPPGEISDPAARDLRRLVRWQMSIVYACAGLAKSSGHFLAGEDLRNLFVQVQAASLRHYPGALATLLADETFTRVLACGTVAFELGLAVLLLGFVVVQIVRLDPPWNARFPRATQVVYYLDLDAKRALRVSNTPDLTPWARSVLVADGGEITTQRSAYGAGGLIFDIPLGAFTRSPGIGAGYYLQDRCPDRTYVVLEGREALGGTWDLFRYPGIR